MKDQIAQARDEFKRLHQEDCFVIPNPWDIGSAIYLKSLGFKALATTSAGYGYTRGFPDAVGTVPLADIIEHTREIVAATTLPVSADFQEGYATDASQVYDHVRMCLETGVAGLSIEDASGNPSAPLYSLEEGVERIRAAKKAILDSGQNVLLTGRCEAWLVKDPTPFKTVMTRLTAYAEAGADCLFAPGIRDLTEIKTLTGELQPLPVNVVVGANIPGLTVQSLRDVGVRRISIGSAFARAAWGAFMKTASEVAQCGTFKGFSDAVSFAAVNEIFT